MIIAADKAKAADGLAATQYCKWFVAICKRILVNFYELPDFW
jgi:hypothetical protein